MDGWVGGWMGGWVDGWMDGWMDGWIDGWMDGWIDGWMDLSTAIGLTPGGSGTVHTINTQETNNNRATQ